MSRFRRGLLVLGFGVAACLPGQASAQSTDPLVPMTVRIGSCLRQHEVEGITRDARYAVNPSEVIRLSVVSQLLGFNDLCATFQGHAYTYRKDVTDRADFLISHYGEATSGTAFDGMLGYALLGAYDITGDTRYLNAALPIVDLCMRLRGSRNRLNWGLMSAMALGKFCQLTGDPAPLAKTLELLGSVVSDQSPDGSFAHYCGRSTDVHYTAWMGMELVLVQRYVDYPPAEQVLQGIEGFLARRIGPSGQTTYMEPCPGTPSCWLYYYSIASGCPQDYDTRAWVNELGYDAVVFDHFRADRYADVMRFLDSLEVSGTVPDKWDHLPPVSDPIYAWASADTSVIRASVVFWSLASMCNSRYAALLARYVPPRGPLAGYTLAGLMEDLAESRASRESAEDDYVAILAANEENPLRYKWFAVDSLVIAGPDEDRSGSLSPGSGMLPVRPPIEQTGAGGVSAGGEGTGFAAAQVAPSDVARLGPLAPNPAVRDQTVRFWLSRDADVSLTVYDAGGRQVRSLLSGWLGAGEHSLRWDRADDAGRPCPSGLYLVGLRTGSEVRIGRIVVIR